MVGLRPIGKITDVIGWIEGFLEYSKLKLCPRRESAKRHLVSFAKLRFCLSIDIHVDLRDLEHQDKGPFFSDQERIVYGNNTDQINSIRGRLTWI